MFPCKICETFKNTYFEDLRMAAAIARYFRTT